MFARAVTWLALVVGVLAVAACQMGGSTGGIADYKFSAPVAHDNLTVFLIRGEDRIKGHTYISLQEAMEQKKLTVYETGEVNQLQVENLDEDQDVYIQTGDIVKGGRQDRVLGTDLIVQAKSGRIPIDAFCVENGRWTQRGAEDARQFSSSNSSVPGNALKLAASYKQDADVARLTDEVAQLQARQSAVQANVQPAATMPRVPATGQGEVWATVAQQQEKLSKTVGEKVNSDVSGTSLQLSLENGKVREAIDKYIAHLKPVVEGQPDAIGFAVVINGKVKTVDVYASHTLFVKLWPKMIEAAATEAVAELEKDKTFTAGTEEQVKLFMASTANGKESRRDVSGRVEMMQTDSPDVVCFETHDKKVMQSMPAAGGGGGRGAASGSATVHQGWVGK